MLQVIIPYLVGVTVDHVLQDIHAQVESYHLQHVLQDNIHQRVLMHVHHVLQLMLVLIRMKNTSV